MRDQRRTRKQDDVLSKVEALFALNVDGSPRGAAAAHSSHASVRLLARTDVAASPTATTRPPHVAAEQQELSFTQSEADRLYQAELEREVEEQVREALEDDEVRLLFFLTTFNFNLFRRWQPQPQPQPPCGRGRSHRRTLLTPERRTCEAARLTPKRSQARPLDETLGCGRCFASAGSDRAPTIGRVAAAQAAEATQPSAAAALRRRLGLLLIPRGSVSSSSSSSSSGCRFGGLF